MILLMPRREYKVFAFFRNSRSLELLLDGYIFWKLFQHTNFGLEVKNKDIATQIVRRICCMASFLRSRQLLLCLFLHPDVGGDMCSSKPSFDFKRSKPRYIPENTIFYLVEYFFFLFRISWFEDYLASPHERSLVRLHFNRTLQSGHEMKARM